MKRLCLVLVVVILQLACNHQTESKILKEKEYPSVIDSLNLQHLYDKAKWIMYCMRCDDTLAFNAHLKISDTITFGVLPLKFDEIGLSNKDTIELQFYFYYQDSIPCDKNLISNNKVYGVGFNRLNDSAIYFLESQVYGKATEYCDSNIRIEDCPSRFVYQLQPDVIEYIRKNQTDIDAWFRTESEKKGIISKKHK